MAKPKLSLIRFIQLAYIIRTILGRPLYEVVDDLINGSGTITDKVLAVALEVLIRLEEEGIEITVNIAVVTYVVNKIIIPSVGHKKIIDLGFAEITL